MARKKTKYQYAAGRVHHLVLWKYDDQGKVLYSESDLRTIMENKHQQYVSMSFTLHDNDVYDQDAVDEQNDRRHQAYLRELILLSEMAGLAEDETTISGYVYSEAIEEEARQRSFKLFREIKVGEDKPPHWHIIINFISYRSSFEIANWFKADASRDEIKGDVVLQRVPGCILSIITIPINISIQKNLLLLHLIFYKILIL